MPTTVKPMPQTPVADVPVQERATRSWIGIARAELGVSAFLLALGALVLYQVTQIPTDFVQRGPVGPRALPAAAGALLLVVGALHAVDVLRGGRGEAEAGEDVEAETATDWRTLAVMGAAFAATAVLIDRIGWPLAGALLFWLTARALGAHHALRDLALALGLSFGSYLLFVHLLGVYLPAGPFEGML
jgi:putative tricarboxylic transport membrane protein